MAYFSGNIVVRRGCQGAAVLALLLSLPAGAAMAAAPDLNSLSLEELADVQVTSVTGRPQPLTDAAASIYVISAEDIRRSGATSIPELLRLAPNLQVAQVDSNQYAITARGFAGTAANKLLVLIDGRSVYTPLFSGVFWDVQGVMLEDIDRIEVISGPGGTLWGTNAVNGVINIITRSAADTQGGLAAAYGGNQDSGGDLRYGARSGATSYRVYGRYSNDDHSTLATGEPVNDAAFQSEAGFRSDWQQGGDQLSLIGNAYRGAEAQPAPGAISISGENFTLGDVQLSGANLTAHWTHDLDNGSRLLLESYYDQTERDNVPQFNENLDIADIKLSEFLRPQWGQSLTWGLEYRTDRDHLVNSPYFAFLPADLDQHWASLFVQDEFELHDNLHLTLGSRVEDNAYAGTDWLPTARLAWKPSPDDLLWTAYSRTVRAPSRLDHDAYAPGDPPYLLAGGPDVTSESANVYELGYRGQPAPSLSYSATVYHAVYDHLSMLTLAPSQTQVIFANGMTGWTTGLETWGNYQMLTWWRWSAGFTALRERLWVSSGLLDLNNDVAAAGQNPDRSWQLRSSMDLPGQTEVDVAERHVTALSDPAVTGYYALDLILGWHPRPDTTLQLATTNLLDQAHGEFTSITTRMQVGRVVVLKAMLRFK